ncbi:MAG: DUF1501 domain-containing protein [Pseudomonadota bacterium]
MASKTDFTRRHFLQSLSLAAAGGMLAGVSGHAVGASSSYTGKFLINVQLLGGLDVTSFADPKINTSGKPIINNWATTAGILQAGNIQYAPYADNARFFDKYYKDILVINGIDAQTNSHSVGVLHNGSGRNTEGFPSLTALFAAAKENGMPMPYLSFGGYAATQGVTTVTQPGRLSVLQNLLEPSVAEASGKLYFPDSDWERIVAMHKANIGARSQSASTLEGARLLEQRYVDALARSEAISDFADMLPTMSQLQPGRRVGTGFSTLHQQLQVSLLAFKAGMSVATDVFEIGFDTHDNHETRLPPVLANTTDALDFLWTYAASLGIADRVVVVIGSDFGRTPFYNSIGGKDHWPIGSTMVMQQNVAFTNRVVGLTDEGHNARKLNPRTLQEDAANGVLLKPSHVHKALRKQLGLDTAATTQLFPFTTTEDIAIFG